MSCTLCSNVVQKEFEENERNWIQLLFYLIVFMTEVPSFSEMNFSHQYVKILVERFLYFTVTETFAFGLQNSIDHDSVNFGNLWLNLSRFRNFISAGTRTCKFQPRVIIFWLHHTIWLDTSGVNIVCSKEEGVLFSEMIFWYPLMSFGNSMRS